MALLQGFALALVAFTALMRPALAEEFPSRPITILVPLAPGGGVDFVARTIGQKLSERLGKPVLIENRPGGGTVVAAVALAKAPPDGYAASDTRRNAVLQYCSLQKPALRPAQGLRADRAAVAGGFHADDQSVAADQVDTGVDPMPKTNRAN
jgi:tripartite-type tricarboxylate transporter receptor subunit TctC